MHKINKKVSPLCKKIWSRSRVSLLLVVVQVHQVNWIQVIQEIAGITGHVLPLLLEILLLNIWSDQSWNTSITDLISILFSAARQQLLHTGLMTISHP